MYIIYDLNIYVYVCLIMLFLFLIVWDLDLECNWKFSILEIFILGIKFKYE